MKQKIAITGNYNSEKTLIAQAISILTGLPFIQNITMYEYYKIFGLDTNTKNLDWKDLFLVATSSFIKRIESETNYKRYISDGVVFSEMLYLKYTTNNLPQDKMRLERNKIVKSLENVMATYASQQYDYIIHLVKPGNATAEESSLDELYTDLYINYNLPYKIYTNSSGDAVLEEICSDLNLPMKMSVSNSLRKAELITLSRI